MIKANSKQNNSINIGIELLRALLCLYVICFHCSFIQRKHLKYFELCLHVPTFFLISFYFYYTILKNKRAIKITSRFQRLLFPYVSWSIIIFILDNILTRFTSLKQVKRKLSLKDLYLQILIGFRYYRVFWFQFSLMIISLFFTIISFLFKDKLLTFIEFFGIISLYLIFSQINGNLFSSYSYMIQGSIGRLNESIPLAVIGCIYGSLNLLLLSRNITIYQQLILFLIFCLLVKFELFVKHSGFLYSNSLLFLLGSSILFILFGSLKFDKFGIFKEIIKNMTKYTGGIYYTHDIFPKYLYFYLKLKKIPGYLSSIIIYIICYLFCFVANKLIKNNKFKYLFM